MKKTFTKWYLVALSCCFVFLFSSSSPFDCEEDGLFPHPATCLSFIECDNGYAFILQCPGILFFCSEKGICTYPYDDECAFADCDPEGDRMYSLPEVVVNCHTNASCFNMTNNGGQCDCNESQLSYCFTCQAWLYTCKFTGEQGHHCGFFITSIQNGGSSHHPPCAYTYHL